MNELENKIAVVVGAGCIGTGLGNGRATAITFAREGATVICADIDTESATATAEMIRGEGNDASVLTLDITDESHVADAVRTILHQHGRIDVLDNNVGIAAVGGVTDVDPADWQRVFKVNLDGAFNTMRHVIPAMVANGGGSIVNISSVASIRWSGVAYAGYYASKAALNHLSRTTAAEFADRGVRVNAVLPGLIKTPMVESVAGITDAYSSTDIEQMWSKRDAQVPMGRMGESWDVAHAALFLASDRAKYITGAELVVDGGISLGMGRAS
ncbi:SDR family oxidoreductase [Rhodococcus sp. 1R11]|uniref:SDR family NAD(P)-dependent oxidoreductase n=1 Tax=Rhodococcus sp. 1R11 TaxID=2559614 RepID=UPI001071DA93|nr:SDR family NAD(P)-dependent oxidoreductase [Rhodococcus sp. 1R11]TFI44842.1 SDR family oxidoreductase [Rhodococcus sp. 1R11]